MYVCGVSCIMCVKGCRLLKCVSSVMKDAEFFIAHYERGESEEEKKKKRCCGGVKHSKG